MQMMAMGIRGTVVRAVVVGACLTGFSRADASVVATSASLEVRVQELIGGVPGSITSDADQYDGTGELPLEVVAELTSVDLGGELVAHGTAIADFLVPATGSNPQELALESACYSNGDTVSYRLQAVTAETRTLVFTTEEVNFGLAGSRDIESRIFLSGAIVLWTQGSSAPGAADASVSLTVTRGDTDEVLFVSSLTLGAEGDGDPLTAGPLAVEAVPLDELGDRGVDAASLEILDRVQRRGTLRVLLIPSQSHAYVYTVRPDEAFPLTARLELNLHNAPGGTGVAAVMGRPFERLADFIERGLPGVQGQAVQRAVNESVSARDVGAVEPPRGPAVAQPLCGAFGAEFSFLALPIAGLWLLGGSGFRRTRRLS